MCSYIYTHTPCIPYHDNKKSVYTTPCEQKWQYNLITDKRTIFVYVLLKLKRGFSVLTFMGAVKYFNFIYFDITLLIRFRTRFRVKINFQNLFFLCELSVKRFFFRKSLILLYDLIVKCLLLLNEQVSLIKQ